MISLLDQLSAVPPSTSWNVPEPPPKVPRRQLSDAKVDLFRVAMQGKGWFLRVDLEALLKMTRPQVNHALSKCLCPLGYVEREQVTALKWRYRWKETT